MINKRIIINFILLFTTVVSATMCFNYKSLVSATDVEAVLNTPVIYNNVFIDSTAVGGLTKAQAMERLESDKLDAVENKKSITIRTGDNSFSRELFLNELGFSYNYEVAVNSAYEYGRKGTASERKAIVDELENKGYFITSEYEYDENAVRETLMSMESEINSSLEITSDNFKVDMDRLVNMVTENLEINVFDVEIIVPVMEG